MTGYRLDTETTCIVQAAHIHQHAVSANDDPTNGLALTPDAHWMFDQGLWTAALRGDRFVIHVAIERFKESSMSGPILSSRHGQELYFHTNSRLRPAPEHLEWHRKFHQFKIGL